MADDDDEVDDEALSFSFSTFDISFSMLAIDISSTIGLLSLVDIVFSVFCVNTYFDLKTVFDINSTLMLL